MKCYVYIEIYIENPRVGGSNPPPGTIFPYIYQLVVKVSGLDVSACKNAGCPMGAIWHGLA